MSSAASFSSSVFHFCQEIEEFWAYQVILISDWSTQIMLFSDWLTLLILIPIILNSTHQELLEPFSRRLAHCCLPELLPLLDLAGVKIGRARQLHAAGFSSPADIARSSAKLLVNTVQHLSYKAASALIQAAKLHVMEKAEALKDEAEIAMIDIN